jgi:hypothetical protein
MGKSRIAADGKELEWAIQDSYVKAAGQLGMALVPIVLEFHKGNAQGGKTFMTKGIPDTLVFYRKQGTTEYRRLWIEFKKHDGVVSPAQNAMIRALRMVGEDVLVCYDSKSAIDALTERVGLVNQRR